jgi:hypothetical protein
MVASYVEIIVRLDEAPCIGVFSLPASGYPTLATRWVEPGRAAWSGWECGLTSAELMRGNPNAGRGTPRMHLIGSIGML